MAQDITYVKAEHNEAQAFQTRYNVNQKTMAQLLGCGTWPSKKRQEHPAAYMMELSHVCALVSRRLRAHAVYLHSAVPPQEA